MTLLWLSVIVAAMAALVAVRFTRLAIVEPNKSRAQIMMIGIVCAAIGVFGIRVYWLPWYWAKAQGGNAQQSAEVLAEFWGPIGNYHVWGLYALMLVYVAGLHFHLNVSRSAGDQVQALRGLILIIAAAGIVPALAWWWR